MTVENALSKSGPFIATGTSGVFPRNFLVFDEDHLRVIRVREGVETDLTSGVGHTGIGDASGSVVISSGIQSGDVIYLLRAVPNIQQTDYNSQGRVRTEVVERSFDLVTMQLQDVQEVQSRALTLPVASEVTGAEAMAAALAAPQYAAQAMEAAQQALEAGAAFVQREGSFFANGLNPGSMTRFANRVFVGEAWQFTGGTEGSNAVTTWLHGSGGAKVQPGTVSVTNGSLIVTGTGTQFTLLSPGGTITIGGSVYRIQSIASNTSMTLQTPATQNLSGATFSAGTGTIGYLANFANLLVANDYGIGVTGAVVTSTTNSGFGGAFVAKTGAPGSGAWGLYVEGIKGHAGASYTHGAEIEVANLFPTVSTGFKPYGGRVDGQVWGLTVGSGADPVVNPVTYSADTGIAVTGVGSNFMSGLVFEADGLFTHADGKKRAALLPTLGTVSWWDASHNQVLDITSSAAGAAKGVSIMHNNVGLTFNNAAGNPFMFVSRGPDVGAALDYVTISATQGAGAQVGVGGPAADVNLHPKPKGNGSVTIDLANLRSYGSDAAAAAGGVPINGLYRSGNALMVRLT